MSIDSNAVLWALQNSCNPDPTTRSQAEKILLEGASIPGYTRGLIQLIATPISPEMGIAVKQAACIQLKQRVSKNWDPPSGGDDQVKTIPEDEKAYIRENICEALISEITNGTVRKTLCAVVRTIAESDYPEKWPTLLDKIVQYLPQQQTTYPALLILRLLCKAYNYRSHEKGKREPLYRILEITFPILIKLAEALQTYEAPISGEMQTLIGKIFWSAIQYTIPPYLTQQNVFMPWMSFFAGLLVRNIPPAPNADEKERWPWWLAKKRAANIFNKLFARYGSPKRVKDDLKQFSQQFVEIYAVKILEAFLDLLRNNRQGQDLPDRLLQVTLEYIDTGVRISSTYRILKPHVQVLLTEVVFPLLCFSEEDQSLWNEDPLEFLRREFDFMDEFYSARRMAQNLLYDLVTLRGTALLDFFMYWIVGLLSKYNQTPPEAKNPREKDGALSAVGHLAQRLKTVQSYQASLEAMIQAHVLPEFDSPFPFLRAKACWVFSQFWDIEYKNPDVFNHGFSKVLSLFKDPELPVRIRAACSVKNLVQVQLALDNLYPILPQVLEEFFRLMNEVDNDDLVTTLEYIIDAYGDKIEPYAIALCGRLATEYLRLASNDDEETEDATALAAVECLNTIQTILQSIHKKPQLYPQAEDALFIALEKSISNDYLDYFEEIIRILSFLTYYSPTISPKMWSLFPRLYQAFEDWAIDYIGNILVPMDNYISRSTEVFLTPGTPYLEMVFNMYKKLVGDPKAGEVDSGEACKLIEVVLHNCKGRVDHIIPAVVECAVRRLDPALHSNNFKILLLEVVANALYYNPGLTVQVLEATQSTQKVFALWFNNINNFKRVHDKKVASVGLSALFMVPFANIPDLIRSNIKIIIQTITTLLANIDEQKKAIAEAQTNDEEEEEDDDEEEEDPTDVPETEDITGFDTTQIELLAESLGYGNFDDEEDDDELLEDEEDFTSPIDNVDELIFFVTQMQDFARRDPENYARTIHTFTPEELTTLNNLSHEAENRKKTAATPSA